MPHSKPYSPGSSHINSIRTVSPFGQLGRAAKVGEEHPFRARRGLLASEPQPHRLAGVDDGHVGGVAALDEDQRLLNSPAGHAGGRKSSLITVSTNASGARGRIEPCSSMRPLEPFSTNLHLGTRDVAGRLPV